METESIHKESFLISCNQHGISKEALIALQKCEAIKMLIRSSLHDLGNELMVLCASAEMIQYLKDEASLKKYLDQVKDSADRAGSMIAAANHIINPRVTEDFQSLDLQVVVKESCQIAKDVSSGKIKWVVSESSDEWIVLGSRDLLMQALLNVLNNAINDIGDEGGLIHVNVCDDQGQRRILIGSKGKTAKNVLSNDIFEAFLSHDRLKAGLGLTTARWIVDAHGGSLELCKDPGGSVDLPVVFDLRIPPSGQG